METFDFIVIGAGSAGCALANRLSEDPRNRVCLIEAGGEDKSQLIHVPLGFLKLLQHDTLNWRYETVPQSHAGDRKVAIASGRVLGGSSSINLMVYHRGQQADYDGWAERGNTGWSWNGVLPYFLRAENNENFTTSQLHGTHGPLTVRFLDEQTPLSNTFIEGGKSLGYPQVRDFIETPMGFGRRQVTQRRGRRWSSAAAYLSPIRNRPNLRIMTDAAVHRLLLDGRRVVGAEVEVAGAIQTVRAGREVILSAGAIGSPKILMLSGIGEAESLAAVGVPVVHHLPGVGRNLQDHISVMVGHRSPSTVPYGLSWRSLHKRALDVFNYAFRRRGLFSVAFEAGAFLDTTGANERPDIQFTFVPALSSQPGKVSFEHGFAATVTLLYPESRGDIRLKSADAREKPLIDPQYLARQADVDTMVRGMKVARDLFKTPSFRPYVGPEVRPGADCASDEAMAAYVRGTASSIFHMAGTCSMGSDGKAVVDEVLRVHGIDGLRVADCSIMPRLVGGNTNAPAIMIGEKAADLVLGG